MNTSIYIAAIIDGVFRGAMYGSIKTR